MLRFRRSLSDSPIGAVAGKILEMSRFRRVGRTRKRIKYQKRAKPLKSIKKNDLHLGRTIRLAWKARLEGGKKPHTGHRLEALASARRLIGRPIADESMAAFALAEVELH